MVSRTDTLRPSWEIEHGERRALSWDSSTIYALRRCFVLLIIVVLLGGAVQCAIKSLRGAGAIVRWRPLIQRLVCGEDVYVEGTYPNPPLLGIVLYSLTLLPPVASGLTWYALKVAMAAWSIRWALDVACGSWRLKGPWVLAAVVLVSHRPLLGDLQHGNVNILILFLVLLGLKAFRHGHDCVAGLFISLATAFKVTPALFIAYFAFKRQWRIFGWTVVGLCLHLAVFPSLVLGPVRNLELLGSWVNVMVYPYVFHGTVETTQVNQSLPGTVFRLFTDSPGIEIEDHIAFPVNWFSLDLDTAFWIVKLLVAALIIWLCAICRTNMQNRSNWLLACEYGLVFIAMLLIAERSWKHHYVTMVLPYAVLVTQTSIRSQSSAFRFYLAGTLAASFLFMAMTSNWPGGLLAGGFGHKYAQAYGMFVWSGVVTFVALSLLLIRSNAQPAASRTTGSG